MDNEYLTALDNVEILYYGYNKLNSSNLSPIHCHDFSEFTYILHGTGYYYVNDKKESIKEGDILVFPPTVRHGEVIAPEDSWDMLVVAFDVFDFSEVPGFFNNFGENFNTFIDTGNMKGPIRSSCEEIIEELTNCSLGYRNIVKNIMDKIFVLLLRSKYKNIENKIFNIIPLRSYDPKEVVDKLKSYIEFYYSSELSLDMITHNIFLSKSYIIKIFKEQIGETPISYLIKTRIKKACELLTKTTLTLESIAKMVGYSNAAHFSKIFKKYMRVSPREFRRNSIL